MCDINTTSIPIDADELLKQRKEKRKEIQRAAAKRFYEKNKEKVIKQNTEYIKNHREPHNKRCREYQRRKTEQFNEIKNKLAAFEKLFENIDSTQINSSLPT